MNIIGTQLNPKYNIIPAMFRVHSVCITHEIIRECCPVAGNEKAGKDNIVIWRVE